MNGQMAGVWRHARKGRRVQVEIEPLSRLPGWARPQLEAEAERVAAWFGGRLDLRMTAAGD